MRKRFKRDGNQLDGYDHHVIPLRGHQSERLINEHISNANYLLPPRGLPSEKKLPDLTFHSNSSIWEQIIYKTLRYNTYIVLDSFFVFEWLPRSPGLYFTDRGQEARQMAQNEIDSVIDDAVVYNPYGKGSMLEGGVGNIRLKPITINGQECFLVGASASGVCHEGFPIALPSQLYNQYIDQISERGANFCTVVGKLKFIPNEVSTLYQDYTDVPQLYLLVEDIKEPSHRVHGYKTDLSVSVAVSFLGEFREKHGIYASYVNFNPRIRGSFQENINWMEQEYVTKTHKGTIFTDFDQQVNHFPNAVFSLEKVMSRTIDNKDVSEVREFGIDLGTVLKHQRMINISLEKGDFYMGSKYNISGGNQGAVGDGAQASNFLQTSNQALSSLDLKELAAELSVLRQAAKQESSDVEHDIAIGEISAAESSAKKDDRNGVIQHLAKAGPWVLDVATKIGVALVVEAIKQATKP